MPDSNHDGGVLTIDLGAIAANYRLLRSHLETAECSAVVKANAYGLGAAKVAPALARAGCKSFFVATFDEGIALRAIIPVGGGVEVYVLNGVQQGSAGEFHRHGLVPVLNDLGQIETWQHTARGVGAPLPAILHIDTGMNRLGLGEADVRQVANEPARMAGIAVRVVMSHLACAEDAESAMNIAQLERFNTLRAMLPTSAASLANSAGIFLGPRFHFDLVRPGIALYGANPCPGRDHPMAEVVRMQGKIVQVRDVDSPQSVGYGAAYRVARPGRVATVSVGYADGFSRALSDRGHGYVGGVRVPAVGRVSMDLSAFDVTEVPPGRCLPGTLIDLIGGPMLIEDVATDADTITNEILIRLGSRLRRVYLEEQP
jgi:alanine racemase